MSTTQVYVPDTFLQNWGTAREDIEAEVENGTHHNLLVAGSVLAKLDQGQPAKRGRGTGVLIRVTPAEAKWLAGEARYRWEFECTDAYGLEASERNWTAGRAARRLLDTLERIEA